MDEQTDKTSGSLPAKHQTVIIGAGISGLSAARYLQKNGITDVIVLEATSKAGGRILTENFGNGLIELGAQWIHGEQNEFCQLIKASNHRHVKTSWEGKGDFLCPDGSKIDNAVVDEVLGWLEDNIEKVESVFSIETVQDNAEVDSKLTRTSMGKYLQDNFYRYLKERYPDLEDSSVRLALFQWGMSFQRIDNSCQGMNDVSLYRWSEFEVNPGEHYNNFVSGAQSFVDKVLNFPDSTCPAVIYNSPAKNINWESNGQIKITTEDESTYLGDIVLVTLSMGVLKSNLESLFTPNIPDRLSNAIYSTGYGPVTKIFLEWAEPWWPSNLKGFQLVWPNEYLDCCEGSFQKESLDKTWHKTITGFDPVLDNRNVLLAWLGGPEAVYAETLSDTQVQNRCVQILRDFTGFDVPLPTKVAVSKWNTDRFFEGAYSYRSVTGDNVKGDISAVLSDPITVNDGYGGEKPVIILAGEALSKNHYSTLHGAYESGIAQAMKVVKYFNDKKVKSSHVDAKNISNAKDNNQSSNNGQSITARKTTKEIALATISVMTANNDIEVSS